MKIHILSDLHNEFLTRTSRLKGNFNCKEWYGYIPETTADLIVLAGDINCGLAGVEWAIKSSNHLGLPIIYVSGNHEYYNREYYSTLKQMRDTCKDTNVHFLENDEILIDDVRILGATLWTNYDVPDLDAHEAMDECENALNDHRVIRMSQDEYFSPEDARKLHVNSVNWLEDKLNGETDSRRTLVVTHHGPSKLCQHKKYPVSAISAAFHSDLSQLVEKADCWVYGHTHSNLDEIVGNCRLVSNQPGYPSEDVADFNSMKVIEV